MMNGKRGTTSLYCFSVPTFVPARDKFTRMASLISENPRAGTKVGTEKQYKLKLIVFCTGYQQASLTIQITKYRLPVCLRLFFPLNG